MIKGWQYKGINTALNGLTGWIDENVPLQTKDAGNRHDEAMKMILEYGKANIPDFKNKGHLSSKADFIAKKIDRDKKFSHFTAWIIAHYKKQSLSC